MLETVKRYIKELPDIEFNEYYQQYIFSIQDENIYSETAINDTTFISIDKLLGRIRKELGITK